MVFGQKEWNKYHELQALADLAYQAGGDEKAAERLQNEANVAYENYEYAAGLRSYDY